MLAVFYHLPSLETLGIDVRADVSLALSVACYSVAVLGVLTGLQLAAVRLGVAPRVPGGAVAREMWTAVIFNSCSLAVSCTTYYSLCGNGSDDALLSRGATGGAMGPARQAVCAKWLAPILTAQYPKFSAWMLVGEGPEAPEASRPQYITIDFPLDGLGAMAIPSARYSRCG
ncbi:hypothetical protein MNEG_13717 [Monoraphidium neglectum]|uniref:Uncharacterized protein n=1 Tax=Monoraphidium neglectum TaxID=145388 RepID=A0A0D2MGT1_9CHLO|nr:hypothetical protein MNEG_13717 [Monoraphidium neglectum]KIY94245.1 hypothetical protein MNEG_13717 [Monoraphidium neglectum]|eukprot:XP_013893265.1 hypothetical protein MNEG_13717 [Monoraphidium neglectum]